MKATRMHICALTLALSLTCTACTNAVSSVAQTSASSAQSTGGAQPSSSAGQAAVSSETTGGIQPDLTDLKGLEDTYLLPILFSAATRDTWTDANSIPANRLVDMYGYMKIFNAKIPESQMEFEGETPYYYLDEAVLETYVQSYFTVSTEHLHSSDRYHADRKAYAFNMSGVGWAYAPSVVRAEYDETAQGLTLYIDDGYEEIDETSVLKILLMDDSEFQYVSNTVK